MTLVAGVTVPTITGTVTDLFHYPIKGLSAQRLAQVPLTAGTGFPGDRAYALARRGGLYRDGMTSAVSKQEFFMLAKDARLAGLATTVSPDGRHLTVRVRGHVVLRSELTRPEGRREIEEFFGRVLGCDEEGLPMVVSGDGRRFTDVAVRSEAMMNAVSIINLASVRALEKEFDTMIDPQRFRANIYVDLGEPFVEQDLLGRGLRIGRCEFRVELATKRCAATEVNPATARRDLPVPRLLVQTYGDDRMGVYATTTRGGTLCPGQRVEVIR